MDGETWNLAIHLSITFASISYSYFIGKVLSQGTTRFIALFPIIPLFLYLPMTLESMIFSGITVFFLTFLATSKIILFAFDKGPLALNPPLPFSHFIVVACLPIKILKNNSTNQENPKTPRKSPKDYVTRFLLFSIAIEGFVYKDYLHPLLVNAAYSMIIFLVLEFLLALAAFVARALTGFELEPQFNQPQKATSVQDFWGKRWNLMMSSILRSMVYVPARRVFGHVIPQKWVSVPAVFTTFLVSGLAHELIFYYFGRAHPTWELMCNFVIQGTWVAIEIIIKKTIGKRYKLPQMVARVLTLGFIISNCFWQFFPSFLRFHPFERVCREGMAFVEFVKHGHMISHREFVCPY